MPLLKTINDYFMKECKPILIERDILNNDTDAQLDLWEIIHLSERWFYPETQDFYFNLLHEFIHLDNFRTYGSPYRYRVSPCNQSHKQDLESEIDGECEKLMEQNCTAFKLLKERLKSARFIIERVPPSV